MSDSIMKMLQQQNENYENAIQDAREQLAKQAEQIKELRITASDQTEVINTERIINSEQAEQLEALTSFVNDCAVSHIESRYKYRARLLMSKYKEEENK